MAGREQSQHSTRYTDVVGSYMRDMISIHLSQDGNGRANRIFALYEPLKRIGLPRPRLRDPDADYQLALTKWTDQIRRGILSNHYTYSDAAYRLETGLPVAHSPELLYPDPPRDIRLRSRRFGKRTEVLAGELSEVDPRQFAAFVRLKFKNNELPGDFQAKPLEVMDLLREQFKEFTRNTHIFFTDKHGVRKEIGLIFVDADFMHRFGTITAPDPVQWNRKMNEAYGTDLVWRGLSTPVDEPAATESEIRSFFEDFVYHSASEGMKKRLAWGLNRRNAVREAYADFERFNNELLRGTMWRTILGHVKADGSTYENSYGFSTSLDYATGRRFARGFLVVSDKADYVSAENQSKLSDRILVGAARADFFVDTNRLKLFSPQFSSQYPASARSWALEFKIRSRS